MRSTGPTAMTIAGFDPSSGAGITADLAVFAAHGIFATSAITSLTVQSTVGVLRSEPVNAELLAETLACVAADLAPDGIKIGMLGTAAQADAVIHFVRTQRSRAPHVRVVLDPVIRASSGAYLLDQAGVELVRRELLPLIDVVTPNAAELEVLSGVKTDTTEAIGEAAWVLSLLHPDLTIVATGGDRAEPEDVVLHHGELTALHGTRVQTRATHGTGCAFSTAMLCALLQGRGPVDAARYAKTYVTGALTHSVERGAGNGPINFFWQSAER